MIWSNCNNFLQGELFLSAFFGAIGVVGFIFGIVLMILGRIKKKKYRGWLVTLVALVVFIIAVATTPNDEKVSAEKTEKKTTVQTSEFKLTDQQKTTIDSLSNFETFINNYKNLGDLKTPTWDNYLYKKKVTWSGTVMEIGTKQIYVWGVDNYNGQTWDDVSESGTHDAYNVFVAKFDNGVPTKIKAGDRITVSGSLESRGDYDMNYEWKIYNAELK